MSADTLMANWFSSASNVLRRKRLSSQSCRSELIDPAWVVTAHGRIQMSPPMDAYKSGFRAGNSTVNQFIPKHTKLLDFDWFSAVQ